MVRVRAFQYGHVIFEVRALAVTAQLDTAEQRPAIEYTLPDGSTGHFSYGPEIAVDIFRGNNG